AVRIQRLDFVADESGPLSRRCACRDAQTNLVRMFIGKERASVERRAADQVDAQLIELAVQPLANDVGGKARSCKRVRAAVADLTFADVAGDVSNADLETLRPAPRARAGDCDAVASDFAQRDGRKIGNDVGREIPVRIGY